MTTSLTMYPRSRAPMATRLLRACFLSRMVSLLGAATCVFFVSSFTQAQTAHFSSATRITAIAPASPESTEDTTVTRSNGTSAINSSDQFLYYPSFAVGTASGTLTATLTITTVGQPSTISVLTQGAPGLDFQFAPGGTCNTATSYTAGQTCTVEYTFAPVRPGQRLGAIQLSTSTGVTIATQLLTGTGIGPQVTFSPGTVSTLGSGFYKDSGVAVDGSGNIFVADGPHNAVKELVAVNGVIPADPAIITVGSGFSGPSGVAVDGAGDVFVADFSNSAVKEIVAVNGTVSANSTVVTIGSGFIGPIGVAVDGAGNVFVGDTYKNAVYEIVAVNGAVSASSTVNTIGSGFGNPSGVAVDSVGNVFVADKTKGVYEIVAANGAVSSSSAVNPIGSGFDGSYGVAVDDAGDVFVADCHHGAVKEIVAVDGAVSANSTVNTVGSGFGAPGGVAVDGAGNVFVADLGYSTVARVDLADAPSLSFASTAVGATSSDSPQTVTIVNNGNSPLNFEVPSAGLNPNISANFTFGSSSTCPQLSTDSTAATLASGASCTILISFTPTASGSISGSLIVSDNSRNASGPYYAAQTVALSGTATPPSVAALTSIASTILTLGRAATAFTPVTASGGVNPLTFSVSPALPAGLSLSPSAGVVSGRPALVSKATTYTVTVTDANGAMATATFSLTVNSAVITPTSTAVSASTLTPTYGAPVELKATVTPAPGDTPPGTARFYTGSALLGTVALNSTGVATLSTALPLGPNVVTSVYSGSENYAESSSSVFAVSDRAESSITFSASPTTQLYNSPIVLSAHAVSTASGTLTGTASFFDGTTLIGTAEIGANGNATYSTTALTDGSHTLSSTYSGDANFVASVSKGQAVAITVADLHVSLGGEPDQSVVPGAAVAYDLELSPQVTSTFVYNVNLTATGLPPGATYTFSPAMIAAGSASVPVTLTVQTATGIASLTTPRGAESQNPSRGIPALAFGLLLPLLGAKSFRNHLKAMPKPLAVSLLTVLSLGAVVGLSGCQSSGFHDAKAATGKYTITVTATSANLVRTTTVQLTIQ